MCWMLSLRWLRPSGIAAGEMHDKRGGRRHRVFIPVACLVLWGLLTLAGTGCSRDRSSSENAGGADDASATAPTFRNLGKRAESPL